VISCESQAVAASFTRWISFGWRGPFLGLTPGLLITVEVG